MSRGDAPQEAPPHAVSKLWAFFVLGILVTTLTFMAASWQGLEHATRRRLAIMAAAIGRVEQSYLSDIARDMGEVQRRLKAAPAAARDQVLRHYISHHAGDMDIVVLGPGNRVLAAAKPFALDATHRILAAVTTACHPRHGLCFSPPFALATGGLVLFGQPLPRGRTLIFERPLPSWPHLRGIRGKLPAHFHIFILDRSGALEYRLPHPTKAHYRTIRTGALMHAMRHALRHSEGEFSGETRTGLRLGAYQSAHYGLLAGVSLPLKNLIATFVNRLEIPVGLILALLLSATIYYRASRRELTRAEGIQASAENRIRAERAFAEQQRDFYLALSELNQFIVRHPEPDHLFAETCRIIIAYTGLLFAWIGRVEPSGDIRVVAFSEKRPLGIDWYRCVFTADPNRPEGLGTAGRAVRSGHIEITDDLAHDARFTPWHDMHVRAGTKSAAALPIRTKSGVVAILALGSEQLSLFAPALVRLLEGLAQDLAFSLEDTEREQQLIHQARHDALTGLDNRILFRQKLTDALALPPPAQKGLAVVILDLDGFKAINDQFGHIVGDELLRRIAARIREAVPAGSTVARLGGDEFGLLFTPLAHAQQAVTMIDAIRQAFTTPFVAAGHDQLAVAASIGISLFPQDGSQVDDLIRRADLALYEAKRLGKNLHRFFTPALEERIVNQRKLQNEFATALRERIPVLYFQPQVEIASGRVRGLEALIRWPRPDGKVWAPAEYFPVIEQDADLMRRLDLYVLEEAYSALAAFCKQGLHLPVAVNIHSLHLLHPDFLKTIQDLIGRHENVCRYLEIEITETSELPDLAQAATVLTACRALGVSVALDDFGTGYASLNYLQKLPCDILKIDKSFVTDMSEDPRDFAIVSAILTAARVLRLTTVAEGVEQEEQGLLLRDLGCEYAQGYVISRPLPFESVAHWVANWHPRALWTGTRRSASTQAQAWLARAGHRGLARAVSEMLHQGRPLLGQAGLTVDQCPLHAWLKGRAPHTVMALHAHGHELMAEAVTQHQQGSQALVTTLMNMQVTEDALDTWLMHKLTDGDYQAAESS